MGVRTGSSKQFLEQRTGCREHRLGRRSIRAGSLGSGSQCGSRPFSCTCTGAQPRTGDSGGLGSRSQSGGYALTDTRCSPSSQCKRLG